MANREIELHFPFRGLDESRAYVAQAGGQGGANYTTPLCDNVCGYDPKTGRNRGSSRSGTRKWCSSQVNGTAAIQDIAQVVGAVEPGVYIQEDGFAYYQEDDASFYDLEATTATNAGERLVTVVATAGGEPKVIAATGTTSITSGSGSLSTTQQTIFSVQFQEDLYFCDGTNYKVFDVSANEIVTWTASSGTLPVDANDNIATLIERWHGRVVLSGVAGDPRNWFMSAVDDPLDWDYAPATISATMAIAGNNSDAGYLGDIVTAMIPYTDDVLIFGGDHTIYRMTGDPADGGRLDLVSDITGIAFGRAWCKSPEGTVYFVGSRGGIYRLDPGGGVPQRLTAKTIDERLADVDMDANIFRLAWDDRHLCVRVFVTPKDGSASSHYAWDVRNEAWWPFSFTNSDHNPMSTLLLSGYSSDDRMVLMGGQDGYVRIFDPDSSTDDGESIESSVFFGPFSNVTINEWAATLGESSGNLKWSIHEANTLELALSAKALAGGQFSASRNRSQWPKRYIRNGYIRLGGIEPWSIERISAMVEQGSSTRKRNY